MGITIYVTVSDQTTATIEQAQMTISDQQKERPIKKILLPLYFSDSRGREGVNGIQGGGRGGVPGHPPDL